MEMKLVNFLKPVIVFIVNDNLSTNVTDHKIRKYDSHNGLIRELFFVSYWGSIYCFVYPHFQHFFGKDFL